MFRGERRKKGFTLIELLVVLAIIGVLAALFIPAISRAISAGQSAACRNNLHQMYAAFVMYMDDHGGRFFPWVERREKGTLWYWGLEYGGGKAEGARRLDKSKARLAAYFDHVGGIEICPSLPYSAPYFKRKFDIASYGYGLNAALIAGTPANRMSGISRFDQVQMPSETIVWADAAQVNTWQSPASSANPMLEEFYYLDASPPAKFHFRHAGQCNAVMADGSGRTFTPANLDERCDGLTGYIEPQGENYYLRPIK